MLQMTLTDDNDTAEITEARRPAWAGRMRLAVETTERRRGVRVRQVRPVKLLDMTLGRTVAGQTLDVSATGMRIALAGASGLRVGDVLGVHVGLSMVGERMAHRRPMVPVRIVWVDPDAGRPGTTLVGVEFTAGLGAQRDAA